MLIRDKKHFIIGVIMAAIFVVILVVMSRPVFKGRNAFEAADRLYDTIAKGSCYKIPKLEQQADKFKGTALDIAIPEKRTLKMEWTKKLLDAADAELYEIKGEVRLRGDLGQLALVALKDADAMYYDRGKEVSDRYGIPPKEVLYTWWKVLKEAQGSLKRNKKVRQASFLDDVVKKGVEVGYNFYGIAPEKASAKAKVLTLSLIFYVGYTIWWGFSIFFLFEGFGLVMAAGKKEEM